MSPQTNSPWTGRDDGPGLEHARWHSVVRWSPDALPHNDTATGPADGPAVDLIGFSCDAGVARNKGRVGAAEGPGALRGGLASLAVHQPLNVVDRGDVTVTDDAGMEHGQDELSARVAESVGRGVLACVLGGGHETAWGTFRGVHQGLAERSAGERPRIGVLNLDQHFDLREEPRATSGTPFLQISRYLQERGEDFVYAVAGISVPNNTRVGFETADRLGVSYLLDEDCADPTAVRAFVQDFLDGVDAVYLTLDLDVLPASVAPGVSAPAAYGVAFETVRAAMLQAARSGKLAGFDVVELNPRLDVDSRTAKSAARLINDVVTALPRGAGAAR